MVLYSSLCSGPQDFKSVMCNEKSSWKNFFLLLCNISFFSPSPSPSFLPPIQWFVFINFRQSRDVRVWNVGNKDFLNIGTVTRFDVWWNSACGKSSKSEENKDQNTPPMTRGVIASSSFIEIWENSYFCLNQ